MNKFLLNKAFPLAVIGAVSYVGYQIGDYIYERVGHSEYVESRITQNISRYIKEQKEIGIDQDNYFKFNFDVPLISDKIPQDSVAVYPLSGNTIFLRSLLLESRGKRYTAYPNTTLDQVIDQTAHHEMIHYYMAQTCGCGGVELRGLPNSIERFSQKLIAEGVAEYLSLKVTHTINPLTDQHIPVADLRDLPAHKEKIESQLYPLAAVVVQPLLEKFGPNSMCYLFDNPPTTLEILDLREYQNRMDHELILEVAKKSNPGHITQ